VNRVRRVPGRYTRVGKGPGERGGGEGLVINLDVSAGTEIGREENHFVSTGVERDVSIDRILCGAVHHDYRLQGASK